MGVPKTQAIPEDWQQTVLYGSFEIRRQPDLTQQAVRNLVRGKNQTALVLETNECPFTIQEGETEFELAEQLPVEAICVWARQDLINELLQKLVGDSGL